MKNSFIIKSFQNGISIIMDPEVPFEELIHDIGVKFSESRAFFGSSNIALALEGRTLTHAEEFEILNTISENSDLDIICIMEKVDDENINFVKALQTLQNKLPSGDYMKVQKGSLKENAILESQDSVLILGDVEPECTVISDKNIIVLGSLLGEAHAGKAEETSYIIALEMQPESMSIGDFKYRPGKKTGWLNRKKIQPKIALIYEDELTVLPLTKDILESL